jgi:hypothetical protein
MRTKTLLTAFFLMFWGMTACAQKGNTHHNFIRKIDDAILKYKKTKVDTDYVDIPERDFMLTLKFREAFQTYDMEFPVLVSEVELPDPYPMVLPSNTNSNLFIKTNLNTVKSSAQIGFDWHGLAVSIPLPINNSFAKAYSLASNGSKFGFTVRYRTVKEPKGTVNNAFLQTCEEVEERVGGLKERYENGLPLMENHDPVFPHKSDVIPENWDLRTVYADAYYVFNNKRFSMPAARTGRLIQKRSVGSFFVMANYNQSRLHMYRMLNYTEEVFRHNQFSIGAGYGYNWAINGGKLLFSISVIPMFSLVNRETHRSWDDPNDVYMQTDPEDDDLWEAYDKHFYDAATYGRDSQFTINGFVRGGINYNIGRSLLNLSCDYRQYLFRSCTGMDITNREIDLTLKYGYRF